MADGQDYQGWVSAGAIVDRLKAKYGLALAAVTLIRSVGGQEFFHVIWKSSSGGDLTARIDMRLYRAVLISFEESVLSMSSATAVAEGSAAA